jgi:ATP-binding cassette subfamily B protein
MKELATLFKKILKLYSVFDTKRKYQVFYILLINIFNGLLEYLTLFAVSLFLSSLSDPKAIIDNTNFLSQLNLNIKNDSDVVFYSTLIFSFIILFSSITRIANLWINMKYRTSLITFLQKKSFSKIIQQNYNFHISTNSSDLLTILTTDIEKTNFFIENLQTLVTSIFIGLSLTFGLVNLNAKISLLSVLLFFILYTFLGRYTNKSVKIFSKRESKANSEIIKRIIESLGSIRELILAGNQSFVLNKFNQSSDSLRINQGYNAFITTFSRFAFEGIGLFLVAIIGYLIFNDSNNTKSVIALLGTFALGALKLLPTMQSIYRSYSLLYFYEKPLEKVLEILYLPSSLISGNYHQKSFKESIEINNLSFKFPESPNNLLKNINLKILKGEKIGIIGKTGSGKTTLINLIMGLLSPTEGSIKIDNESIFNSNKGIRNSWLKNITLVPQEIFLYDSTIYENIAFNINLADINKKEIEKSAKLACAHEFIVQRPNKYNAITGEKGINFSGGQKQRLGIARAIYSNTEVIILDEATSALDQRTEDKVIGSLLEIKDKTIISITHRVNTLKNFDKIIVLENGTIKKICSGKELNKANEIL